MKDFFLFLGFILALIIPFFAFYKMYHRIMECKRSKIYAWIVSLAFSMPTVIVSLSLLFILGLDHLYEEHDVLYVQLIINVIIIGVYVFVYFLHNKKEYIVCIDSNQDNSLSPLEEKTSSGDKKILIGYNDKSGNLTIRAVEVLAVHHDHFDAYCHLRKAQRTFSMEGVLSSVTDTQTCLSMDKWEWFESIGGYRPSSMGAATKSSDLHAVEGEIDTPPDTKNDPCSESSAKLRLAGSDILFTGFTADMRVCLEDAARACGMVVRTKVTKNLSYLVCGPKDAPAKRLEAINVGASIIYGKDEFRDLVTG